MPTRHPASRSMVLQAKVPAWGSAPKGGSWAWDHTSMQRGAKVLGARSRDTAAGGHSAQVGLLKNNSDPHLSSSLLLVFPLVFKIHKHSFFLPSLFTASPPCATAAFRGSWLPSEAEPCSLRMGQEHLEKGPALPGLAAGQATVREREKGEIAAGSPAEKPLLCKYCLSSD